MCQSDKKIHNLTDPSVIDSVSCQICQNQQDSEKISEKNVPCLILYVIDSAYLVKDSINKANHYPFVNDKADRGCPLENEH